MKHGSDNIFKNLQKENIIYGKVITSSKDETKIYGKEYLNRGNVLIFNEGNFYCLLEIFLKNFLVGNTSIIVSNGYMYGSTTRAQKTVPCRQNTTA